MIDRKKAIEELNTKICFIPQKYADSDMSVKDVLAKSEEDCEFLSTEGEVATLLAYNPLSQLEDKIQSIFDRLGNYAKLDRNALGSNAENPMLAAEIEILTEVQHIITELKDSDSPATLSRSKIAETEKFLAAYITYRNEAQYVLQEIIHMLFDAELYSNKTELVCSNIEPMK